MKVLLNRVHFFWTRSGNRLPALLSSPCEHWRKGCMCKTGVKARATKEDMGKEVDSGMWYCVIEWE